MGAGRDGALSLRRSTIIFSLRGSEVLSEGRTRMIPHSTYVTTTLAAVFVGDGLHLLRMADRLAGEHFPPTIHRADGDKILIHADAREQEPGFAVFAAAQAARITVSVCCLMPMATLWRWQSSARSSVRAISTASLLGVGILA